MSKMPKQLAVAPTENRMGQYNFAKVSYVE